MKNRIARFSMVFIVLIFLMIPTLLFSGMSSIPSVAKFLVPRATVAIAAAGVTFDTSITVPGGRATRYILECPDMTGDGSTTLSIINANAVTVYSSAAHPEDANYSVPIDVELVGTYTVRLTLSIAAGGAGATAYFSILGY